MGKGDILPIMKTETLQQLYYAYCRPNRFFHNLEHIGWCFIHLKKAVNADVPIQNEDALRYALWFHDYIYEGTRTDNEELSADAAYDAAIRDGHTEDFARTVQSMVLATKHSDKYPPITPDEELICDIDLSTLADDNFAGNTAAIRKEYAHVPEGIFIHERRRILQAFLDRPFIYRTQFFRDLYEEKARANLKAAIEDNALRM